MILSFDMAQMTTQYLLALRFGSAVRQTGNISLAKSTLCKGLPQELHGALVKSSFPNWERV